MTFWMLSFGHRYYLDEQSHIHFGIWHTVTSLYEASYCWYLTMRKKVMKDLSKILPNRISKTLLK